MSALPPLRAPRQDGQILAVPPLQQVGDLLERNRKNLSTWGGPWPERQARARQELMTLLGVEAEASKRPLLVAGHQPELFHPGVWLKNFALHDLARRFGGTSVNLVIDNDAIKSYSLTLPPAPGGGLIRRAVAFGRGDPETPWEEVVVEDRGLFAGFRDQVTEAMRGWGVEPIMTTFWPRVCRRLSEGRLAAAFAGARVELEREWGCHNHELAMSHLCQTEAFASFLGALIEHPERLFAIYNASVQDYRKRHGLRSKNHPVPDLARDGEWYEVPLWAWRADRVPVRRGRVFARREADRVWLRVGTERVGEVVPGREKETQSGIGAGSWKIRSRALATTLFARTFLGDLFIHGIGGGKYDELTDDITNRLWNVGPTGYMVLTGTSLLPLHVAEVSQARVQEQGRRVRDMGWNPERYLEGEEKVGLAELLARKRDLMAATPNTAKGRKERFRAFREVHTTLREATRARQEDARRELGDLVEEQALSQTLRRRDYAFCLYPEQTLRSFWSQFL